MRTALPFECSASSSVCTVDWNSCNPFPAEDLVHKNCNLSHQVAPFDISQGSKSKTIPCGKEKWEILPKTTKMQARLGGLLWTFPAVPGNSRAVLVASDIFGIHMGRHKEICDSLADEVPRASFGGWGWVSSPPSK